jgi:hypothetical protein
MALQFPKQDFHGYTAEELQAEYDKTLKEEAGKGVSQWVKGWKDLGGAAKTSLEQSWSEALMSARWAWGTATPEERQQMEAMTGTFASGVKSDATNIWNTAVREAPRTFENGGYLMEAIGTSTDQIARFPGALLDAYEQKQKALLPLADSDPMAYQRESAKVAADALNRGLPVVFDTLIGGAVARVVSKGHAYAVAGKGAAVVEAGEAMGVLTDGGRAVKGTATSLLLDDAFDAHGLAAEEAAALEQEGAFLKANPKATVLRSTDQGKVYSLPNLGGVPEPVLDAKAGVLKEIETGWASKTGAPLELAEVLKPGSPLAKAGGVAKTELTAPKTGKPEMLDAGMPEAALGEASVWRNPVSPADANPDFANWPNPRQEAALAAWKKGNAAYKTFMNPAPGSKEALFKQCVGKLGRVPLDAEPKNGLQRFVEAEFEQVKVKEGRAEALLLRVKSYAIEVVDTDRNVVVNRKTVVNSARALPQTPDADAVAVAKVVGRDRAGQPILGPLSRAEREYVMPRYVSKNIELRRTGAVPSMAEHGPTLVMDDAAARAAGSLLPNYGVPFLPDAIGRAYLARIAKFVAPAGTTADDMLAKMLRTVEGAGGFGQHAVVVTSDSRFFGEVPFGSW